MTLASWFSCLRHSRRRLAQNGARRSCSRAFRRTASLEVLEDRLLLSSVSFASDGETYENSGTFTVGVTLSNPPSGTPAVSTFASVDLPALLGNLSALKLRISSALIAGEDRLSSDQPSAARIPIAPGVPTDGAASHTRSSHPQDTHCVSSRLLPDTPLVRHGWPGSAESSPRRP